MLGLEAAGLQVYHHEAAQAQVVEEEVKMELLAVHFQGHLLADKGEAGAHLQQELADLLHQATLQVALGGIGAQGEEVEHVRVFDHLLGQVALGRRQRGGEVGNGLPWRA